MNMEHSSNAHKRKAKKTTYKKWTDDEQRKILNFLKTNQPLEKPTAQLYYRRFMSQYGIDSDWSLIRSKVKNMRTAYCKIKMWENSQEAEVLDDGQSIQDIILKKCPLFYELEEVFGKYVSESLKSKQNIERHANNWDTTESTSSVKMESPPSPSVTADYDPLVEVGADEELNFNWPTAMLEFKQVLESFLEVKKQKMDADIELKEKELQLQTDKFLFEKEKHLDDMKLKEKELESNEKLKIMELKMKETISLKELEMKERIELAKIKQAKLK